MKSALVLFAHGAREPEWAQPLEAIRRAVAARRSDLVVEVAFLELMAPDLAHCLARLAAAGCGRIAVAPLFLAPGGHLKRDLPRLLEAARARHPGLEIATLPALGEAAEVLDAIAAWLAERAPRPEEAG